MLSAGIKQRINSTYAEYNDGSVELEARFGRLTQRGFKPGVSRQVFNRIREYFDQRAQVIETRTTDYISKNVRKTVTVPTDESPPQTIWITKTRMWNEEDPNYGIRYSTSREIPIHPVNNFVPEIIREKSRYSYNVFKGMVRIDMTVVNMVQGVQGGPSSDQTKYEVEIELINPLGLTSFEKALQITLHRVLDTVVLYNTREANSLISYTNMLLGSDKRGVIDHYPLVQARNLKLKDMVWGGLVGNEQIVQNGTGYSVTHKADGQRKMLVFHSSGVWMVMAPYSLNRLTATEIPALTGTVLDGEIIPLNQRLEGAPNARLWYLAFDCICWNSDRGIQNRPHGIRMNHAQAVADLFKTQLLLINTKSFKNFTTPQQFFAVMREMFREQVHLRYKQDGFMFTPVNAVYNPHSDTHPLYRRVLTDYPDICKWKPQEQLTIDFQIRWAIDEEGAIIILYVNSKGKPVRFNGTKTFPYQNTVDDRHPMTAGLPNGTIVEYGWDYERGLFIPHKIRHDKTKPNKIDIAGDVWMDIQRPLDQATMEGESFSLLRAYHNRIKKFLFNDPNQNPTPTNPTLLDIGSGRGGDVAKWRNYSRIVAVEPNAEHIQELERRIAIHGMQNRVRIVHAGGQDIEAIYQAVREFIGDRVDVVSMMLSMSFFWQNQSMVNRLINTITTNIKRDGKMIFLTIDGDLVEQTFEPAMDTGPAITRLDLGPATLTYDDNKQPKELHIHIEGTIVQDQTEWLVRLNDLILPMRRLGFDYQIQRRADDDRFLNEEEITMTQMYTYAIIHSVNPGITLPDINQVLPGREVDPGLKTNPAEIQALLGGQETVIEEIVTIKPLDPAQPVIGLPPIEPTNTVLLSPIFTKEDVPKEIKPVEKMDQQPKPTFPLLPTTGLPPLPGMTAMPALPTAQPVVQTETVMVTGTLPGMPTLPTITLPTVPGMATVPTAAVPGVPTAPAILTLPTVPGQLSVATLPTASPTFAGLPPVPTFAGLPPLPVGIGGLPTMAGLPQIDIEMELPGIQMDTFEELTVTWYPNETVVRIGAIGDGSCFFHAALGGYYPVYQNNNDYQFRRQFVSMLRRDVAYTLEMEDPENLGMIMWQTAANGQFTALYEQQLMGLDFTDIFDYPVDFSLNGLQQLFNSTAYLGNEVYQYASDILGIDIYVMRLTNRDLYVHQNTSVRGLVRKVIVISGNGNHYETIGVERGPNELFQTVFDQNDPFILALRSQIDDEGGTEFP